jgi:hypothetical protein
MYGIQKAIASTLGRWLKISSNLKKLNNVFMRGQFYYMDNSHFGSINLFLKNIFALQQFDLILPWIAKKFLGEFPPIGKKE